MPKFVLPKCLPFFKLFVRFTLLKQSYFPTINISMAILNIVWMKAALWYTLFSFSKRSMFTFIIIKPKTKLCFSFSNIGSIITNFASQKVKNLFWVTVKGPTLNFKYFPTCFCCKSVSCNYMITHLTSSLPTWFRASNIVRLWQRCSHEAVLKGFTISESHYWNLRKNLFMFFIWC